MPIILLAQIEFLIFGFHNITLTGPISGAVSPTQGSGSLTKINISAIAPWEIGFTGKALNTNGYPASGSLIFGGIQIMGSTVGYENIEISWYQAHMNGSANRISVKYTLDGTIWLDFIANDNNALNYQIASEGNEGFDNGRFIATHGASAGPPQSDYYIRKVDLSAIAGANNNPNFGIQFLTDYPTGQNAYMPTLSTGSYNTTHPILYDTITFSGELPPTEVSTLTELRTKTPDTGQRYCITGFITVSMASGNKIYAQDSTNAGICIVDTGQLLTTAYSIGDVLTNVTGVLEEANGMLTFTLRAVPMQSDSGYPINPISLSLDALVASANAYQSRLVKVSDVFFHTLGDFENDTTYQIKNDSGQSFAFKTIFADVDYIGDEIPSRYINITGIISRDADGSFITARSQADFAYVILPPNNLTASAISHNVTLQWEPPVSPTRTAVNYNVYRGGSPLTDDPISALTFNEDIANFGYFSYTVTAVYPEGESVATDPVEVLIARLNPPQTLTSEFTQQSITLNWQAPSDEEEYIGTFEHYNIYRNEMLITTPAPVITTTFTDNSIQLGVAYTYSVTAQYTQGESDATNASEPITPVINPPQALNAQKVGLTVELSWQAPSAENNIGTFQYYKIYRNTVPITAPGAVTIHTFTDTDIQMGGFYEYTVSALYTEGESTPSNTVEVFFARLNPPRNLTATINEGTILLNWLTPLTQNGNGTFQHYKVFRNETPLTTIDEIETTALADDDIEIGETYTYAITAQYEQGESVASNTTEPTTPQLNPPQNLTATINDLTVVLNWQAPATENNIGIFEHYSIYRNGVQLTTPEEVITTSFTDTDTQIGSSYTYSVTAQYTQGESAHSNTADAFFPRLNPPRDLSAVISEGNAILAWLEPLEESGMGSFQHYNIYRNETLITTPETVITTNFTDNGLQIGNSYTYTVTAQYTEGESTHSNPAEVAFSNLNPPRNLIATMVDLTVVLTWQAPATENNSGAFQYYIVYRNNTQITPPNALTTTTFTDSNVQLGGLYTYTVTAKYAEGESEPSNLAEAFFAILNPPRNLEAVLEGDVISLSWFVPSAVNGIGTFRYYKVYRNGSLIPTEEFMSTFYTDTEIELGIDTTYTYFVTAQYLQGESIPSNTVIIRPVSCFEETLELCKTELLGNYPNPFNPNTAITFALDREQQVEVVIYNLKGQRVNSLVNSVLGVGLHTAIWNGLDDKGVAVSSGIYFYQMKTQGYAKMRKMLLVK